MLIHLDISYLVQHCNIFPFEQRNHPHLTAKSFVLSTTTFDQEYIATYSWPTLCHLLFWSKTLDVSSISTGDKSLSNNIFCSKIDFVSYPVPEGSASAPGESVLLINNSNKTHRCATSCRLSVSYCSFGRCS